MSDRFDHSTLDLLDRADEISPPMSVEPEAVIAAGRRKVRRRRTSAAGGVGALALVGALWLGGPLNPFAPDDPPTPASISWQEGVEVELFDNAPNPVHEPDRVHWTGQLRSLRGAAFPELVLSRDGEQLDPVPAQDGPGDVLVFPADGLTVAVWKSPAGSLGESPLWAPGVYFGQGGPVEVAGAQLRYAAVEFVPGATGELEELYWYSEDAAHAASGAPVASTFLSVGASAAVLMLDESRDVWGTLPLGEHLGAHAVERLGAGAGVSGWTGDTVVSTTVGVLPPGATEPTVASGSATLGYTALGSRTAVMAVDPSMTMTTPTIRFTLDGEEHALETYVEQEARTLDVGSGQVLLTAQPSGVELRRGERWALFAAEDLAEGRAVVASVMGGQVVVVPAWKPDADVDDLRVLVGTDKGERWVQAGSAHVGTLFDGRPLVVLGLDRGVLHGGEAVRGVGVAGAGGDVVPHALEDGVVPLDVDL